MATVTDRHREKAREIIRASWDSEGGRPLKDPVEAMASALADEGACERPHVGDKMPELMNWAERTTAAEDLVKAAEGVEWAYPAENIAGDIHGSCPECLGLQPDKHSIGRTLLGTRGKASMSIKQCKTEHPHGHKDGCKLDAALRKWEARK